MLYGMNRWEVKRFYDRLCEMFAKMLVVGLKARAVAWLLQYDMFQLTQRAGPG